MTRRIASKNGTMIDVTKRGTACSMFNLKSSELSVNLLTSVAQRTVAKQRIAKQFEGSTRSSIGLARSQRRTLRAMRKNSHLLVNLKFPKRVRMMKSAGLIRLVGESPIALTSPSPISPRRS